VASFQFPVPSSSGFQPEAGNWLLVLNPFIAEDDLLRLILQDFGVVLS
jgi:hypothetical protein